MYLLCLFARVNSSSLDLRCSFVCPRATLVTIPDIGATRNRSTLKEERLDSTKVKQSCQAIGILHSAKFVLEWRLAMELQSSFWWTRQLTLYTHWSLMASTVLPHWVKTRGRNWLKRPLCSHTVTERDLTAFALPRRPELVSMPTKKMIAIPAIPESHLEGLVILMIPINVETWLLIMEQLEKGESRQWDTSWCSN